MLKNFNFDIVKSVFHRVISAFLALLVLFTTTSITLDMHYCGRTLMDYSFYSKSDGCGMEVAIAKDACTTTSVKQESCCTDQQIIKQAQDDLQKSIDDLSSSEQIFVAAFYYSYMNLFEDFHTKSIPFKEYSPPYLERDLQLLYETYLI